MAVPSDRSHTNFGVTSVLTADRATLKSAKIGTLTVAGGSPGDVLVNAGAGRAVWSGAPLDVETWNAGVTPAGLACVGAKIYVANNNNYGTVAGQFVTVLHVDTGGFSRIYNDAWAQPYTVTADPTGTRVYVTNSASPVNVMESGTVFGIDVATDTVVTTWLGFDGPSGVAITQDGAWAYVNNYGAAGGVGSGSGNTVSVVDVASGTIATEIKVDQAPAAVVLSADDTRLYVANYTTGLEFAGTVNVVDTATRTILATVTGLFGPFGIVLHPSGNWAYVTNFGSNNFDPFGTTVAVIDLQTLEVAHEVDTGGIQPSGLDVSPDGKYLYVSNYNTLYQQGSPTFSGLTAGQGTVTVIDTSTLEVIPGTIAVGQSPSFVKVDPTNQRVYVSNYTSNTVSVFRAF